MTRVLIDGQVFSIHKRGGIARVFYSIFQEYLVAKASPGINSTLIKGVFLSKYSEDKKQKSDLRGVWAPPFFVSGKGMAKVSLLINWFYLWITPYRVVHSTYYFRRFLWRRPGTKHIVTLHDMIPEDFPEYFPDGNPHLQKEAFLRNADKIVCVSNYTLSRLSHHYPDLTPKAIVISLGVAAQERYESYLERDSTLLYVGARSGYKDFSTLLHALPIILEVDPRIRILAAGDQSFTNSERSIISKLGLTDRVFQKELSDEELQIAYRTCLLTVVTSHAEGFGLPVIEAMAHGTLVVATDIPVFQEISGDAYVAFRAGDAKDLAIKIAAILNEPENYNHLRNIGLQVVRQYTWSGVLAALCELYEGV
jgi:glycosyltransferase involved in cell wall biosynthesis